MRVGQIMSQEVRSCRPTDSLNEAARSMWEGDCGALPVVSSDGVVVAMITDRDVCMAAYTRGRRLDDLCVRDAMSPRLTACSPGDAVEDAEQRMRESRVRRLPVVDDDGRLVGIVSLADVARALPRARNITSRRASALELGETLGAICEPGPPAH
jgi:CBS domain-containing protein